MRFLPNPSLYARLLSCSLSRTGIARQLGQIGGPKSKFLFPVRMHYARFNQLHQRLGNSQPKLHLEGSNRLHGDGRGKVSMMVDESEVHGLRNKAWIVICKKEQSELKERRNERLVIAKSLWRVTE
uniref:Uncharacterized protein n=1 Tax=Solanum tuberosum TaxID=4113 RepID=M1C4I1_SOLTU